MNPDTDLGAPVESAVAPLVTRRQLLLAGVGIGVGIGGLYAVRTTLSTGGKTMTPPRKLLWSDEFDTLDLVSASNPQGRWRPNDVWQAIDRGFADFGSGGGSWCLNPNQKLDGLYRSPFSVADSVLTIRAIRTPEAWKADIQGGSATPAPAWSGGILISNTSRADMTFGYGYYEIRARWPNSGKGMFPALWFFAAHDKNLVEKAQAEIDLLEIFGHAQGTPWTATLHEKNQDGHGAQIDVLRRSDDSQGWHTYGIDWTEKYLRFYRDRVPIASAVGSSAAFFAGTQMSIRMNYAMDAAYFSADQKSDASTPSPLTMDVDYVRHYQIAPGT